jgi:hypothetical protein
MSDPTSESEPSVCASCGEAFGCGARLEGCWCSDLTLDSVAAEVLKNKFDACLCPKCLAAFASQPLMKPEIADRNDSGRS